jgi:hypothetical protein
MWLLHAVELDDGSWACRWGRQEFDQHAELTEALEHLKTIARDEGPAEFFAHYLDGEVSNLSQS